LIIKNRVWVRFVTLSRDCRYLNTEKIFYIQVKGYAGFLRNKAE